MIAWRKLADPSFNILRAKVRRGSWECVVETRAEHDDKLRSCDRLAIRRRSEKHASNEMKKARSRPSPVRDLLQYLDYPPERIHGVVTVPVSAAEIRTPS